MTPTLSRLAELAKAATPGPWRLGDWSATFGSMENMDYARWIERNLTHEGPDPYRCGRADGRYVVVELVDPPAILDDQARANVAFIAAASPDVVLALCARVRELEEWLREALEIGMSLWGSHSYVATMNRLMELRDLLAKGKP